MANPAAATIPVSDTAAEAVVVPNVPTTGRATTTKIHVDNIPVTTRIEDVKALFARAGEIVELRITVRESRSQISGVVTYKSPQVAEAAVEQFANASLDDAQLNVALVRGNASRSAPAREATATRGRGRGGKARGAAPSRRPRQDEGEEGTTGTDAAAPVSDEHPTAPSAQYASAQAPATTGTDSAKAKAPKKTKAARGSPSKTLLYVSHLAYSVQNADLMELFSPYPAVSANIVYHRQQPKHSRGFAFVDFPNEEAQQKALAELNGKEFHGRIIAISVALQPEPKEEAQDESGASTAAPSSEAVPDAA